MQFMFGRTRVRLLAHAARLGDFSQSNNDADKRTFYCIPCEEPREENLQNNTKLLLFIKKLSSLKKFSDLVLAWNVIMPNVQALGQSRRSSSWT
jgi:hypothetical protein